MSRYIVITTFFLMLSGCSTTTSNQIKENCLRNVDTYGSVIECAIKLDKVHND